MAYHSIIDGIWWYQVQIQLSVVCLEYGWIFVAQERGESFELFNNTGSWSAAQVLAKIGVTSISRCEK